MSNSSFSENITTLSATTKERAHRITGVFRIRKPRDTQKTSVTIRHQVCYSTRCRDTLFTKQTQKYHRQKFITNTQVIHKPQTKKKSAQIHFCQLRRFFDCIKRAIFNPHWHQLEYKYEHGFLRLKAFFP